ncbi:hypothetical protein F511_46599 [Dorcoceras hygrometricum]|uniref:Uncharacterized protein n=1 Tax=Dorcoceras hygrometricum TaxID=472368 RepID=A0A2Z6ZT51_9LAMI|nr:hypothetical protein F511_46599 [Dorcoceras hygrometricum]
MMHAAWPRACRNNCGSQQAHRPALGCATFCAWPLAMAGQPAELVRPARDTILPIARPARYGWSPPHTAAAGSMLQNYFCVFDFKFEIQMQYGNNCIEGSEPGSDTTVGEPWRIRIPSTGEAAEE